MFFFIDNIARRRPRPKAIINQTNSDMISASGVTWKPNPIARRRQIAANIMNEAPGLKKGINPKTPLEAFRLFFDDDTIDFILQHTNQKLALVKESTPQFSFIQKNQQVLKKTKY